MEGARHEGAEVTTEPKTMRAGSFRGATGFSASIAAASPGMAAACARAAAALLAGGLHGLRNKIDPGPPLEVSDDLARTGGELPTDLRSAIARFDESPLARDVFGPEFVDSFLATRRAEQKAFDDWWRNSVSEWEMARYPDHI